MEENGILNNDIIENNFLKGLLPMFLDGRIIPENTVLDFEKKFDCDLKLKDNVDNSITRSGKELKIGRKYYKLIFKHVDIYGVGFYYLVQTTSSCVYDELNDPLKIELIALLDSFFTMHHIEHHSLVNSKGVNRPIFDVDIIQDNTFIGLVLPFEESYLLRTIIHKKRYNMNTAVISLSEKEQSRHQDYLRNRMSQESYDKVFFTTLDELIYNPTTLDNIFQHFKTQ